MPNFPTKRERYKNQTKYELFLMEIYHANYLQFSSLNKAVK